VSAIDQYMVDLRASLAIRMLPGVFSDIFTCKIGATQRHPSGCGKIYKPKTVLVGSRMEALLSGHRSKETLFPDLGISVSDDDFYIMFWALTVGWNL